MAAAPVEEKSLTDGAEEILKFNEDGSIESIDFDTWRTLQIEVGRVLKAHEILETIRSQGTDEQKEALSEHSELIQDIEASYQHALDAHRTLDSLDGWEVQVENSNGISVYHRPEEDTAIESIKTVFETTCDTLHFIAVLNEVDLLTEVVTIVRQYWVMVLDVSKTRKVLHNVIELMWPLSPRDWVLDIRAFECLREWNEIIFYAHSVQEFPNADVPQPNPGTERLESELIQGRVRVVPHADRTETLEVTLVANVDFKTIVPAMLVNWLTRTLAYYACKQFRGVVENLPEDGPHLTRMREKKELYSLYERQLDIWRIMRSQNINRDAVSRPPTKESASGVEEAKSEDMNVDQSDPVANAQTESSTVEES